ncbi:hypothetical protein CC85DRAFT_89 [Cutaneotrichosporon oleaginosum]|uniref:Uncharacterized protein n=1 Tax=Cutaneotrichosporon oleaginosum TaxID=879819 RepID=A0A0J0XZ33_9TREE|nr:uncharacterized protein CC85DRAFT_89 [Cutaneotrichosporon oleaginosum]KLT46328.1 hypothetical protein CC85DRAFT_89 [Cutaneotrichosporon oleaginosum]
MLHLICNTRSASRLLACHLALDAARRPPRLERSPSPTISLFTSVLTGNAVVLRADGVGGPRIGPEPIPTSSAS